MITVGLMFWLVVLLVIQVGCATHPAHRPAASTPPGTPAAAAEAERLLQRGQVLIARGEMAAAVTTLREALGHQPDLVEARASLGLALYGMGDVDGAVEELRAALQRHPQAVSARLTLVAALMARQEWAQARRELEHVLATQPDLLQAHYSLGVVRYAQGDLQGAIDAYRRVLSGDPRHQDARYNLALMLKLAQRDAEATPEFLSAAQAGHPRAQYFAGTAYASGVGVERNLVMAIAWWVRAAEQGVPQAQETLAELRQFALGRSRRGPADRQTVEDAFRTYRVELWKDFPDLTPNGQETVGAALLRQGRVGEAVPVLIREASALSAPAQELLEVLYEQGIEGQLPARDPRIFGCLQDLAAEGLRPPPQ
jgi:tetratricopeptide (TPR) repeat protein